MQSGLAGVLLPALAGGRGRAQRSGRGQHLEHGAPVFVDANTLALLSPLSSAALTASPPEASSLKAANPSPPLTSPRGAPCIGWRSLT